MLASLSFIVAMFGTMLLIPPLMRVATRLNIVDLPDPRKVHAMPVPRIGGVAMIAVAAALILVWTPLTQAIRWYLVGVGIIAAFGIWDDRSELNYRLKFLGQLLAILCVVIGGGVVIHFVPFAGVDAVAAWISIPLTVFALLGITNAINLADGLDGLAGGTTFISIAVIAMLAVMANDNTLLLLCSAILGSIVGFLRFNSHPAVVFMGDAGSQFLGFSAGVLVIILTQQSNPAMSPVIPLLILGLPILDTLLVMGQRIYEGRSPFRPDKNHIHHRLLGLGFDQYEAVVIIYAIQSVMVTSAVLMRYESDALNSMWFAGCCAGVLLFIRLAARAGWRAHRLSQTDAQSPLARFAERVKRTGLLVRVPLVYIGIAIPGYLLHVIWQAKGVPDDALLTLAALLAVMVLLLFAERFRPWITVADRIVICTTITAGVYYGIDQSEGGQQLLTPENFVFVGLVVALFVLYRYSTRRNFKVSSMDFLVIFAVMVLPNLLGQYITQTRLSEVATKALLLYYGVEFAILQFEGHTRWVRIAVVTVLTVFVSRLLLAPV